MNLGPIYNVSIEVIGHHDSNHIFCCDFSGVQFVFRSRESERARVEVKDGDTVLKSCVILPHQACMLDIGDVHVPVEEGQPEIEARDLQIVFTPELYRIYNGDGALLDAFTPASYDRTAQIRMMDCCGECNCRPVVHECIQSVKPR